MLWSYSTWSYPVHWSKCCRQIYQEFLTGTQPWKLLIIVAELFKAWEVVNQSRVLNSGLIARFGLQTWSCSSWIFITVHNVRQKWRKSRHRHLFHLHNMGGFRHPMTKRMNDWKYELNPGRIFVDAVAGSWFLSASHRKPCLDIRMESLSRQVSQRSQILEHRATRFISITEGTWSTQS